MGIANTLYSRSYLCQNMTAQCSGKNLHFQYSKHKQLNCYIQGLFNISMFLSLMFGLLRSNIISMITEIPCYPSLHIQYVTVTDNYNALTLNWLTTISK